MKKLSIAAGSIVLLSLAACQAPPQDFPTETVDDTVMSSSSSSSSSVATEVPVTYEGMLDNAGMGIYMQGTHQITLDDGRIVLLESTDFDLSSFVGKRVHLNGYERDTVEAGGRIVRVDLITSLEEASSSSAEGVTSSSSEAAIDLVSSSAASSNAASKSSRASSSAKASSAAMASSSSANGATATNNEAVAQMAKVKIDASTFTQIYCTRHVGYCVPLHKSWYYQSFGATTSYLWHVEVSSQQVENLGDGPLLINLLSGGLSNPSLDGSIETTGDFIVGYRSWTGNRHFEVSAPQALRPIVQYLLDNITVYQTDSSSAQSSASSH